MNGWIILCLASLLLALLVIAPVMLSSHISRHEEMADCKKRNGRVGDG